ncbi:uncharacterized protein LOC122863068 isoform X1 [Siniperca chuatsi]|uniref:uncharacterized protein LOC122863068 isoform X1 n=1 Tax=Siniperca chuatsi TaxID=119488 RepID=UPI001CE1AD92|nr:uncharacterized protein LOC122863068 isoform X1 [Siniperca chuatsi]
MVEFRWIKMFLYLILVLQFTALTVQHRPSLIVRDGDKITLPCENVLNHYKCDSTSWFFSRFPSTAAQDLVKRGQTVNTVKAKSDRLSVTVNCSLVIKKVTVEDVGRYFCEQLNKSGPNTLDLSVVTMTEHKDNHKVTLTCSVLTYHRCGHTVKWLYGAKDVDKDNKDLMTSQSYCSANVTFTTSHFIYTSKNYELLKCNVTDGYTRKVFTFSPQSSVGANKSNAPENNDTTTKPQDWWWLYIIVAVGLAVLFITAVTLIRWKRNKGNKPQRDKNTADPEDGVSYASISYTRKTNSKARVRAGDDAVTYSIVKAPSSSAGASADPTLYATIN